MELFRRRPLCFFCFLFAIVSLFAMTASGRTFFWCIVVGILLVLIFGVSLALIRRWRIRILPFFLGTIVALFALLHSFFTMELPQRRAEQYVGEHTVLCQLLSKEYESEWGTEYLVKIRRIDEVEVEIRATLELDVNTDLSAGDVLYAPMKLESLSDSTYHSKGALLTAYVEDTHAAYVQRISMQASFWETLTSDSGILILSAQIRESLSTYLKGSLGTELGALASGFFMGDRSDISTEVTRDFRRSGTSHQMAVSGLHVSVLLGSIELLLRKLYVSKRVRCVLIAMLSGVFLILTGFSASACRSVLMLLAVYVSYLFYEENDPVTALFASLAIIICFSPHSVSDIGLWMSFLATLGLVTVYPLCEEGIPYPRQKKWVARFSLRFLRRCLLNILMTVIANLFLLPVLWYFFREFSLISVLSNIVLSPLCYLFLIGIPLLLMLGWIPVVGQAVGWTVSAIGTCIVKLVRFFATLPNATLSLKYSFASVIVLIFTAVMVVLLVIRLRRKWVLGIPPILACISFCICLLVFHLLNGTPTVTYRIDEKQNELLAIRQGSTLSFCDSSSGSRPLYEAMMEELDTSVATEIDTVLLTHYHPNQAKTLSYLMRRVYVRSLCLPTPVDSTEAEHAKSLWALARQCGTEVRFYTTEESISLTDTVRVKPELVRTEEHPSLALSICAEKDMLTYVTPEILRADAGQEMERHLGISKTILIGSHGVGSTEQVFCNITDVDIPKTLIYTSQNVRTCFTGNIGEAREYIPPSDTPAFRVTLPLE